MIQAAFRHVNAVPSQSTRSGRNPYTPKGIASRQELVPPACNPLLRPYLRASSSKSNALSDADSASCEQFTEMLLEAEAEAEDTEPAIAAILVLYAASVAAYWVFTSDALWRDYGIVLSNPEDVETSALYFGFGGTAATNSRGFEYLLARYKAGRMLERGNKLYGKQAVAKMVDRIRTGGFQASYDSSEFWAWNLLGKEDEEAFWLDSSKYTCSALAFFVAAFSLAHENAAFDPYRGLKFTTFSCCVTTFFLAFGNMSCYLFRRFSETKRWEELARRMVGEEQLARKLEKLRGKS